MKAIGIVGCGWLGSKLAQRLSGQFEVYVTTRKQENVNELESLGYIPTTIEFSENKAHISRWDAISLLDVLIILIPFSNRKSTAELLKLKMNNLHSFIDSFNGQLFFTSTTGVYPKDRKTFTEDDLPTNENAIENQMKCYHPEVNILRLGGLMGDDRLLSKYNVTNLEDPVNHVHYVDACSVIMKMIKNQAQSKIYNVVAPLHPTKGEVIQAQLNDSKPKDHNRIAKAPEGRIVSPSKMMAELEFDFKYPDPRTFHE